MLLFILQMNQSEGARQTQGCGPETNPTRESELGVAAQKKFLEQSNRQEEDSPKGCEFPDARAVQDNMSEGKSVKAGQGENEDRDGSESPQTTYAEKSSTEPAWGQSIRTPPTLLDTSQDD